MLSIKHALITLTLTLCVFLLPETSDAKPCNCHQGLRGSVLVHRPEIVQGTWQPTLQPAFQFFPRRYVRYRRGLIFQPDNQ